MRVDGVHTLSKKMGVFIRIIGVAYSEIMGGISFYHFLQTILNVFIESTKDFSADGSIAKSPLG